MPREPADWLRTLQQQLARGVCTHLSRLDSPHCKGPQRKMNQVRELSWFYKLLSQHKYLHASTFISDM